jgi:hypothetical protein
VSQGFKPLADEWVHARCEFNKLNTESSNHDSLISPHQPRTKIPHHQASNCQILENSASLIVKIESWLYVIFVHRLDKGGQFISYRQMEQWKNAVACQLQKCSTQQQLQHLWNAIEHDHTKHNSQYADSVLPFLKKIWTKYQETRPKVSEIFRRASSS